MRILCEICGGLMRGRALAPGQVLAECVACGHLARDLRSAPAGHRDLAYGGEPALDRLRLALTYRALRRHADPGSVFEIGFGAGHLLRRFADAGASVAGADPDQLGVEVDPVVRAAARLHDGPVESVPGDEPQVDLVYAVHVLEHVADTDETLVAAWRLLRPGGVLQCLTPAGDSDGLRVFGPAWWMLEDPTHVRFFTARSLERAALRAGFTDVTVRRPVLDSLTTEVASMVRRVRPRPRPTGVLGRPAMLAAGAACAPAVVALRAVRPALRPTLQLIARRPV